MAQIKLLSENVNEATVAKIIHIFSAIRNPVTSGYNYVSTYANML